MLDKSLKPVIFLVLFVLVVGLACSMGSSSPEATEAPPTAPPAVQTEEPDGPAVSPPTQPAESQPAASGAISSIQDVKSAVVLIQAEGTFVDPEFGLQLNSAGRGTGFIIDPSGIAVTNNHVVTGAALIKVQLADENEWRNARVLGVSECSDLAVIDIDGEDFPYFDWYGGDLNAGLDIYVAGYPLGDPEFTLTKGVVSKARADGETGWASIDAVFEYDANVLPGNSGGPVLSADDARVVGVNYAYNPDTRQAFGISQQLAEGLIERLRQDEDVDSMGINGQAVGTEDGSLTGIWVASVQSGSPADKAGIQPGDLLYQMENLVLATDGSMADYCDILRTHSPSDTLAVSVIRWDSGDIYEGQLNGRELAYTGTLDSGGTSSTGDGSTSDVPEGDFVETASGYYNYGASASGDIAFATDFDGGDLSDWFYYMMNGSEDDFSLDVANGVLHWEDTNTDTWAYLINDQIEMPDVQIDVSVENLGVNKNDTSLICRYNDRGWYEFNIGSDGVWTILRYDDAGYTALYTGGSYDINMGKDTNDFTAVCTGDSLSLYINGVETRTVTDRTFSTGYVGISVSSFDAAPVIKEFDYVVFSLP
ncbi:MAG: trypsin-like peptidase domain-containing protein [Anaerolineales bacterium]